MATATTTGTAKYSELTTQQRLFYEMTLLERAISNFLHIFFGLEGSVHPTTTLPENQGHQIQWRKLSALSAVTTPLTEGVNPDPQNITVTTTTGTVYEYGAFIRYTRSLAEMGIDKIAMEASDALGEQAGDSLDLLTRASLVAETSNIQFVNNRADVDAIVAGDYLSMSEVMEGVTTLRTNKAVGPLTGGKFPALLHPKVVYDMFSDPLFQAILSYSKERGDSNPWISGHIGDAFQVSFYETPNAYSQTNTGSVVVYSNLILGKGSFGVGGLAAYMPQVIREQQEKSNHTFETVRPLRLIDKPFGTSGTSDPFDRLASIAWYTTLVVQVLDATFYVNIKGDAALD